MSPTVIPGRGVWSFRLLICTMKGWIPWSTPFVISLAKTTAWLAVWPTGRAKKSSAGTSTIVQQVNNTIRHVHLHVPHHHLIAVKVGVFMTNSSVLGTYVAVVSKPRTLVPAKRRKNSYIAGSTIYQQL